MKIDVSENKEHNPDYKLIEIELNEQGKYISLVYGIANDGTNEGLEAYYKREKNGHHYKSYRWTSNAIPKKYEHSFEFLSSFKNEVKDGHKIIVSVQN